MNLSDELRKLLPTPCCGQRPFVCNGLPESCDVVVIGDNPGRLMKRDWWDFWHDANGFKLGEFEQAYESMGPIAGARLRLNRLRDNGLNCLVTNFFRNEGQGGNRGGMSNEEVLRTLVDHRHLPNLKAVIVHGAVAREHWHRLGLKLPDGVQSYCLSKHLSRVSYEEIDEVSRKIHGTSVPPRHSD